MEFKKKDFNIGSLRQTSCPRSVPTPGVHAFLLISTLLNPFDFFPKNPTQASQSDSNFLKYKNKRTLMFLSNPVFKVHRAFKKKHNIDISVLYSFGLFKTQPQYYYSTGVTGPQTGTCISASTITTTWLGIY